jgi:ubiquinone/menaquinone biosynthesis C-methylase UbiE
MSVQHAYNKWAEQYDTNENKTRDIEARSLRETLASLTFNHCLEIGCGTGKNTEWLVQKSRQVTAADLSEEMLSRARQKVANESVNFIQADITKQWNFDSNSFDLVTFSLVLEHINNLDQIFEKVRTVLMKGGYVYIGELHPFKQYTGSKARFETDQGLEIVECYNHHISEFTNAAAKHGLTLIHLNEYFDEDHAGIPRILTLLFQKP